ncbi:MAG: hypothetical protein ACTSUC_01750 [Promethearchaeota archaeon]
MGEFITIFFGASAAAPAAVEYDKSMIVGDGSSHLSSSKLYLLTQDGWQTSLEDDGFSDNDQLYKSVSDFFAASPSPERVYAYAYVSGTSKEWEDVPLTPIDDTTWEIPSKPPEGFGPGGTGLERVRFYHPTSTGFQWNYSDGSTGLGFTILKDSQDNWTGQLQFPNGLTGQYGDAVKPVEYDDKITVDFTMGSKGSVGDQISEYGINMVSLALTNSYDIKNYPTNIFGTSQVDDLDTMMSAIAGKQCLFIYAVPGDANPDDLISEGGGVKWGNLKSIVGQREDFVNIKAKPSATQDDMASGLLGICSATHPHTGIGFARPHMAIKEREPIINQAKWKSAKTNYIIQRNELAGQPFMIVRGFTFGTDVNSDRINAVRCKYIILQTLRNGLWSLLSSRTVRMSYKGMVKIEEKIKSIFAQLVADDIVDKFVYVRNPLKANFLANDAVAKAANASKRVSGIKIGYIWNHSLEEIEISALINEGV